MLFYVGLHQPADAIHFDRAFISVNRVRNRKSNFPCNDFILDSGAFTEISSHGKYRDEPEVYASQIDRWRKNGGFQAAVTQDYMCEPFILQRTGLSVRDHQRLTIDRYVKLKRATTATIMPVLQGFKASEYIEHLEMYDKLGLVNIGMRIGVGSVCKRNSNVAAVEDLLLEIKAAVGGMKLHGFGLKTTALESDRVWDALYSADSMAWCYAAWREGRSSNDWREAKRFEQKILSQARFRHPIQTSLF